MATDWDVAVVGGGPGGYVAAIRAAQLGLKTVLVEREHLGGICLNWGCIPTKALLRSAEVFRTMEHASTFGVEVTAVGFNLERMIGRSRAVADRLTKGIGYLLKKNEVTVVEGTAALAGTGRVAVRGNDGTDSTLNARHVILATGARARTPPGLEPDGHLIWTYKEALLPDTMPSSLLVIGSGAIGIEFASFFRTLGAEVTVVEILDRILPAEDQEISALARNAFEKQGMQIMTGASVEHLDSGKNQVTARVKHASEASVEITVDRAILAVGITGNVEGLGLEEAGIAVDAGHVRVNEWCETGAPGVYAIGDLAGPPWLAHKASHEGIMVAERIARVGGTHPMDISNVSSCTYSYPQVASIGLTEAAAKDAGYEVKVGRFPFSGNGKALALGEPDGLIKTVVEASSGELLGAHLIGAEVTELIHSYAVARTLEATADELKETIYPHPTLSEMLHESVLDADGMALHI